MDTIVIHTTFSVNDVFDYPEGKHIEFKKSYNPANQRKYCETICAFLNSQGGYLIFGIDDDRIMCGITQKHIDDISLMADTCYRTLLTTSGQELPLECITTRVITSSCKKLCIVLIECNKTNNLYQFQNGNIYYRNNASNFHYSGIVYRSEAQMRELYETNIKAMQAHYLQELIEYKENIEELKTQRMQHENLVNVFESEKKHFEKYKQISVILILALLVIQIYLSCK